MKLIRRIKEPYSKVKGFKINSPLVSRALIVLIFLILLKIIGVPIQLIMFLVGAIFFNAWLQTFQLSKGLPTDFELSTFASVLVTATFGWKWGLFIAIASKLFACIYTGSLLVDHFFMMSTYINAVLMTLLLGSGNILVTGFIIIIINCILMFMISKNILGIDITANLAYTGTNFIFNSIMFLSISELMLGFLRIRF
ncbi:MAG: hypothetical protein HGA85_05540 [Nanoarchaeota archaeon]|nr:hypothetical protein [Nanoarchaeota archaeon]